MDPISRQRMKLILYHSESLADPMSLNDFIDMTVAADKIDELKAKVENQSCKS